MTSANASSSLDKVYKSLPLTDTSFRVLEIKQAKNLDDPIVCSLRRISTCDRTKKASEVYEALSYVWGDKAITKAITIHGIQYNVTENCYAALRRVRRPWGIRRIFVDSVYACRLLMLC